MDSFFGGNLLEQKFKKYHGKILGTQEIILDKFENNRSLYYKVLSEEDYDFYLEYFVNGIRILMHSEYKISLNRIKTLFELSLMTCEKIGDQLVNLDVKSRYPKDQALNELIDQLVMYYYVVAIHGSDVSKTINLNDFVSCLSSIRFFIEEKKMNKIFNNLFKTVKFLIKGSYDSSQETNAHELNSDQASKKMNSSTIIKQNETYDIEYICSKFNRISNRKQLNFWYELLFQLIISLRPVTNKALYDIICKKVDTHFSIDTKYSDCWANTVCSIMNELSFKRFWNCSINSKKDVYINIGQVRLKTCLSYFELFQIWVMFLGLRPKIGSKSFTCLFDKKQTSPNAAHKDNEAILTEKQILIIENLHKIEHYTANIVSYVIRSFQTKHKFIWNYNDACLQLFPLFDGSDPSLHESGTTLQNSNVSSQNNPLTQLKRNTGIKCM